MAPFLLPIGDKVTATTTLEVRVDARQAVRSLADIKAAAKSAQDSLASMARAASTPFDRLTKTMEALVSPLEKLVRQMNAMRAGMRSSADAAIRQATATDRLAQSVKSAESAQAKAAQARQNDLAAARSWEAQLTKELNLRERIRRQLTGDDRATVRDQLGEQLTSAMTAYQQALTKFGTNSKEGIAAKGALSREMTLVSSRVAEINGLLPTLDRGFEKTAKGWASMSRMDKLQLQSNAINFTQQTIASGGPGQALMVQGPELLGLMARYPAVLAPVAAGFVAVGSAVGVAVAGFSRLADESQRLRDFEAGIRGSGQAGILAADDLAKLSDRLNELPNVGREAADKLVASLSRVRGLGATMTQRVALAAPDYAKAIGEQDVGKAGVDLANKLRDPAKAAREFADSMGLLSASQVYAIERMVASGDRAKAMGVIMAAVEKQTRGLAAEMSPLASMVDAISNSWDRLIDRLSKSNVITETAKALEYLANAASAAMGDDRAKAKNLQSEIDNLLTWRQFAATDFAKRNIDSQIADVEKELKPLVMAQMAAEKALKAASEGGAAASIRAAAPALPDARQEVLDTIEATSALRGYRGERERLLDQQARLQKAMKLTSDGTERRLLSESLAGLQDQLRQAVDPRAKMLTDASRQTTDAWTVARAPYDQREQVTTRLQAEAQAREAGMGVLQREALVRERLSELAAKGVQSVGDSVRAKLEEADATLRMFDVENQGIAVQQRAADELEKQRFAREALAKASDQTRSAVLAEIDVYGRLVDRMGELKTASAFRQQAISASPTLQWQQSLKDAPQVADTMRGMGAPGSEIETYMQDIELRRLDSSTKFADGIERGMIRYKRSVMDVASASERAFTSAADNMTDAITNFAMTGKMQFSDFARSVIADMLKIQVRQSVVAPFMGWAGSALTSLFGSAMGGANPVGTSATTTWTSKPAVTVEPLMNKLGNAFNDNGIARFAKGSAFVNGIYNTPTLFKFAKGTQLGELGEAGPEAVMPLRRGPDGSLGVMVHGGGDSAGAVVVNAPVTVNVEGGATGNPETDAKFAQQIARAASDQIKAVVDSRIMQQMRPGGLMNRV